MADPQPISFPDHEHEGVDGQDGGSADADGSGGAHGHSQSQSQFYEVPLLTNPSNRHRRTAFTGQQNNDDANRWRLRAEALEGELAVEKRKLELERQRSQAAWERVSLFEDQQSELDDQQRELEDQRRKLKDQRKELEVQRKVLKVQQREACKRDKAERIQLNEYGLAIPIIVAQFIALSLLPSALRITTTDCLFWWAVLEFCAIVLDVYFLRIEIFWAAFVRVQFVITAALWISVLYLKIGPILFPKPKPWYYFNF